MRNILCLALILSVSQCSAMNRLSHRLYTTLTKPNWPKYSIDQAFLITEITLRNNHLTYSNAYDRELKVKIQKAASQVCPDHNESKCRTCWRPQQIAFTRVSEAIYKRGI